MALLIFFYFATVIVATAVLVVAHRKPIHSALSLLVMFFHVAGLFVLLNAEFLAVVQIIVYAGAILVLYLFVVMLLDLQPDKGYHRQLVAGVVIAAVLAVEAVVILARAGFAGSGAESGIISAGAARPGNTEAIGRALYTTYLFPFEVASLILLVAMIGAIVLSKKGIFDRTERS